MQTESLFRFPSTIGIWIIPAFNVTMIVLDLISRLDPNVTSSVQPNWNFAQIMLLSLIEFSFLKEPWENSSILRKIVWSKYTIIIID